MLLSQTVCSLVKTDFPADLHKRRKGFKYWCVCEDFLKCPDGHLQLRFPANVCFLCSDWQLLGSSQVHCPSWPWLLWRQGSCLMCPAGTWVLQVCYSHKNRIYNVGFYLVIYWLMEYLIWATTKPFFFLNHKDTQQLCFLKVSETKKSIKMFVVYYYIKKKKKTRFSVENLEWFFFTWIHNHVCHLQLCFVWAHNSSLLLSNGPALYQVISAR